MMAGNFNLLNQYAGSDGKGNFTDDLKPQTAGVDSDQYHYDPTATAK